MSRAKAECLESIQDRTIIATKGITSSAALPLETSYVLADDLVTRSAHKDGWEWEWEWERECQCSYGDERQLKSARSIFATLHIKGARAKARSTFNIALLTGSTEGEETTPRHKRLPGRPYSWSFGSLDRLQRSSSTQGHRAQKDRYTEGSHHYEVPANTRTQTRA